MKKKSPLPIASPLVIRQWRERVVAEYGSAAIASQLLHWLIQIGVSPDLLFRSQEVVREELMHTEVSRTVYLDAGGSEDAIAINPQQLLIPHADGFEMLYRAMEFTADFFCCGETVAAPLFQAMVDVSKVDSAKKSLKRIVKDEEGHGEFGWELLDELLSFSTTEQREGLKEKVPSFVVRIIEAYAADFSLSDDDKAWGLIAGKDYSEITRMVAADQLIPQFESLLGNIPNLRKWR